MTKGKVIALLLPLTIVSHSAIAHTHRSRAAKHQFEVMTNHPHGWPNHWVDHIIPLACGGADAPSNMAWQTVEAAHAKDRWERNDCAIWSSPHPPCFATDDRQNEFCIVN